MAYSTPKEAYEELIPAFQKTTAGKGVSFDQSYGSSGDQSRAVASGLPADVVALSLAPDVEKLVEPGLVDANWADDEHDGFVTNSVVVFAVRKGNPKNIQTWDDIVKDDVEVITPNPFTSGGAKWNLMAAYGSQTEQGKSDAEALDFLRQVLANTPVQDKSARESLQTFAGGKGDVLLAYENEAITAQAADIELDYVIPDQTILIENPRRRRQGVREPGPGERVRRLAAHARRAADLRRQGLPLGAARPRRREDLPRARRRCSRSTSSAAGRRSTTSSSTRRTARWRRSSATWGSPLPAEATTAGRLPRARVQGAGGPLAIGGLSVAWLTLIVLIPLAAVVVRSFDDGAGAFWDAITSPQAVAAIRLTVIVSLIVAAIDAVMGTLIAWVLVRDEFPGKRIVNGLIDLPFALPTIVAGLVLLALYGPNGPVGINVAYTRVAVCSRCCS